MILSTTRITSSCVLTVIRVPADLRVSATVPANRNPVFGIGTCKDLELAGHDTEPTVHAFCLVQHDDTIFHPDCLLPAIMCTGTTTGTKPGIPDGFPDTGDTDLVEPLTLAPVRAGRYRNPHLDRAVLFRKISGRSLLRVQYCQ